MPLKKVGLTPSECQYAEIFISTKISLRVFKWSVLIDLIDCTLYEYHIYYNSLLANLISQHACQAVYAKDKL